MIRAFRVFALLALLGALTACGNAPQPFRGTPKVSTDNPLIDVPAAMGVEILPVQGLAPDLSGKVTRAVAERLLDLEIPAEPVQHAGPLGFQLTGRAGASVTSPGGEQFDVQWSLRSRRGVRLTEFTQTVRVPPEGTVSVAAETAQHIAYAMGLTDTAPPPPGQAPAAAKAVLPTLSVKAVDGAPGDGAESLRLAIMQAMAEAGFKRDDITPDITLLSAIKVTLHDLSQQDVVITWRAVLRDGRELGQLHLENTIPAGALDGVWGPTAFSIASAAQPQLATLLSSQLPPPGQASTQGQAKP